MGERESLPPVPSWAGGFRRLEKVDSTNNWALDYARRNPPDGELPLVVVADEQTAGRGRSGRNWFSDRDVLTFSILFAADGWPQPLSQVALVAGIGVARALQPFLLPTHAARVKWPNDVYVDGRKVAGILVETAAAKNRLVVGIGVNVSSRFTGADQDVTERASSIAEYAAAPPSRMEVLASILSCFGDVLKSWRHVPNWLPSAYAPLCALTGRRIQLNQIKKTIEGVVQGIGPDGQLLIEVTRPDGSTDSIAVESGEVVSSSPI